MSDTKTRLPNLAQRLATKYPGLKVEAYFQIAGAADYRYRTIVFTGPLATLVEYGLAEEVVGKRHGNRLRYRGDGVTLGCGEVYDDGGPFVVHHLCLDPDDDRKVTKQAQAMARQIIRRIQRNVKTASRS